MKTVGIRILKNNLSQFMKYVKMGETILITERNNVIAEIKKPDVKKGGVISRTDLFLEEEVRKGNLIRAKGKAVDIDKIIKEKKKYKDLKLNWKKIFKESRSDRF